MFPRIKINDSFRRLMILVNNMASVLGWEMRPLLMHVTKSYLRKKQACFVQSF